jgi:hypothetical protein
VLIAFWLTVHLQKLESARLVYELDPIIEKVISNLRKQGIPILQEKFRQEEESKRKGVLGIFSKK